MRHHMMKIFTAMSIVAATSLAAMPASAGTAEAVSVHIDRADLMSDAGTKRIYYRLKQSAESACQAAGSRMSVKQQFAADKCAADLMESFVSQINSRRMRVHHQGINTFTS